MRTLAHPRRRTLRHAMVITGLAAAMVMIATPSFAHVTVSPETAAADNYATLTFSVPHGCEGSPTTALSVQIPEGVVSVTPEFIPDWTVETQTGVLSEPVELHGEQITEGITEVTWSGGPAIPDGQFFTFGLSVRLPSEPGKTLYFPAVQTCEQGETRWIQIPQEGQSADDLDEPAPAVTLSAAEDAQHDAGPTEAGFASEATGDDVAMTNQQQDAGTEPGPSTEPVTMAALGIAVLGLLTGVGALITARRRT